MSLWYPPAIAADGTLYTTQDIVAPDGTPKGVYWRGPVTIGADGTLYGGGDASELAAMAPDGTRKWTVPLDSEGGLTPAIGADGTIYVATRGFSLHAVTPQGKVLWKKYSPNFLSGLTTDFGVAVGPDGTIYWAAGALHAFRPDGSVRWEHDPGTDGYAQAATVGTDGTVYAGRALAHPILTGYAVDAIASDGSLKWSWTWGAHECVAPIALSPDGTLHVACGPAVWTSDAAGAPKWVASWGGPGGYSPPTVDANGTVYVSSGGDDGGFFAFNADGSRKWRYRIDLASAGGVSIGADGTLYGGAGHDLYAFVPGP